MNKYLSMLVLAIAGIFCVSCYEICTPESLKKAEAVSVSEAELYYSNLETIVNAAFVGSEPSEIAKTSPIYEKLASLPIVDEDGNSISFFDLPAEEQSAFFKEYAAQAKNDMKVKLESSKAVKEYIGAQNEMVVRTLDDFGTMTKSGFQIEDVDAFLFALNENAKEFSDDYDVEPAPETKAELLSDPSSVIKAWAGIAKKGDFVLAMPNHDKTFMIVNPGAKRFDKGHAETICRDITANLTLNDPVTIGTLLDGVDYRTVNECWIYQHYILGFEIYDLKWSKFKLTKVKRNINPGDIVEMEKTYLGHEYVTDAEFLLAKFAAPERFSCVSLIWWCVKNLYGVDLASTWLLPTMSPLELYYNEYTYVKASLSR